MDRERMKDFSVILLDMDKRHSGLTARIQWLENRIVCLEELNRNLSNIVLRLQSIVALNNVIIGLKRDQEGKFDPVDIQSIVEELLGHARQAILNEKADVGSHPETRK